MNFRFQTKETLIESSTQRADVLLCPHELVFLPPTQSVINNIALAPFPKKINSSKANRNAHNSSRDLQREL